MNPLFLWFDAGSKKEIRHFTVHLRCVFLLLMGSSTMVFAERTPVAQTSSRREVVAEVGRSRGEAQRNASSEEADEADKKKAAEKARKAALKAWRERLKRPVNGFVFEPDSLAVRPDSLSIVKFTQGVHFLDSLKGGQLDSVTAQISRIDYGTKVKYNYRDPFDPYMNQVFYRHGQGKFWFFGLGMLLLVVIMYFRAVFPKQFELRIRGVFNAYYFNELVNDRAITQYGGGSGVVFVFSQAVFSAGSMLYMIFGGYLQLNNFWVFILLYLALLGGVMGLQAIQFLFASSMHIELMLRRLVQRQHNVNFVLSLIFFPLFLVAYYNGYKFHGAPLADWVSFMLVLWIVIRSILSFVGLFQDRQLNFLAFLYFCTLEILPYTVLFASISRI